MTSRGSIPADVWADPRVQHYLREGHFGYIHAHERNRLSDSRLLEAASALNYTHEEWVGLLVSANGRYAAETLDNYEPAWRIGRGAYGSGAPGGMDMPDNITCFLQHVSRRTECREIAANYWSDVEAEAL